MQGEQLSVIRRGMILTTPMHNSQWKNQEGGRGEQHGSARFGHVRKKASHSVHEVLFVAIAGFETESQALTTEGKQYV